MKRFSRLLLAAMVATGVGAAAADAYAAGPRQGVSPESFTARIGAPAIVPLGTTGSTFTFEAPDYTAGELDGQQGWTAQYTGDWAISNAHAFAGTQHVRSTVAFAGNSQVNSPAVAGLGGQDFSVISVQVARHNAGSGSTQYVAPANETSGYIATRVRINIDGTIDTLQVDGGGNGVWATTTGTISDENYHEIKVVADNTGTNGLEVCLDGSSIFTGQNVSGVLSPGDTVLDSFAFLSGMESGSVGSTFDGDNLQFSDSATGGCGGSSPTTHTVSTSVVPTAGGSIDPTSATVNDGDTTAFDVTANSGYHVDSVTGCDGSFDNGTGVYTTGAITDDCTVTANFAPDTSNPNLVCSAPLNHLIATDIDGTSINFSTGAIVDAGPGSGYDFNPYGLSSGKLAFYWGQSAIGAGVAASATTASWRVLQTGDTVGSTSIFSRSTGAAPDWDAGADGYLGVKFNCSSIPDAPASGVCYGYVHMTSTGPNGFPATIVDYCYDKTGADVTISGGSTPVTYTVTSSVGTPSGSISPSGATTVNAGATQSYTLTADTGYHIDNVGGDCPAGTLTGNTYVTGAITADCSVVANFASDGGGTDPSISVSPSVLSSSQAIGATTTQTLTVANTGGGTLTWTIDEDNSSLPPMPTSHQAAQPAREEVGATVTHAGNGNGSAAVWTAPMATLYDNGPLVTDPGAGSGGADASALQTAVGNTSYGANISAALGYRAGDDITVPAGGWTIDKITVFTYQTGSSTTSTITGANLRIWNGVPGAGGSTVVFGDTTTNRMDSTAFSNIYRVLDTGLTNTDRPIMAVVINVGTTLPAGTYWLDWQISGSLASGPWGPAVSIAGSTGKPGANGMQYTTAWGALTDGGSGAAQDYPFIVEGTAGGSTPACTSPSDIPWLSLSATSGSNAGGSNTPVTVTFDSTGMTAGSYSAKLCVASNDTANPTVEVPVSLTVTGGGGSDLVCSGPINHTLNSVDFHGTSINWATGDIVDSDPVTGYDINWWDNSGLAVYWSNAPAGNAAVAGSASSSDLTVMQTGDTVGPSSIWSRTAGAMTAFRAGVDGYMGFRFQCTAGTCYGYTHLTTTGPSGFPATLVDYCYDQAGNAVTITGGTPLNPPAATVTPTSLSMSAPANGTATTTLNVANAAGSSALTYSVQAQEATLRPHVSRKAANIGSAGRLTLQSGPIPQEKLDYLAARENAHPQLRGSGVRGGSAQHGVPWAPTGSIVFALDDGTYEGAIGWTDQSTDTEYSSLWLNRFTATGAMTIDSVSIMWPQNQSGSLVGKQVNIVAYYDADGDGDPSNAVRLGTDNLQSIASLDSFISYTTSFSVPAAGDVYIGFFNTYADGGGTTPALYPAAIDEDTVLGQSWVAAMSSGDASTDITANDVIGTIDDLSNGSLVGTWLIRATGTGGGSGGSCTGPVVTWLTATPASGSVNGGANTNLTVKADPAAGSLAPGSYSAELCLTTNDPNNALIAVPVSLTVTAPPFVPCNGGTDEIFCDGFDPAVVTDPDIVTGTINQPVQADGDGSTLDFVTGVWGTYDGSQQNINLYDYGDGTLTVYWYGNMASVAVGGVVDSGGVEFAVLQSGDTVGPSSTISATSQYMTNWLSGTDGYIGVAFENSETGELNYGYIHLTTTGPLGFPAQALEYAYNKAGNAITIP